MRNPKIKLKFDVGDLFTGNFRKVTPLLDSNAKITHLTMFRETFTSSITVT